MRYGNVERHNACAMVRDDGNPGFGLSRLPRADLGKINPGVMPQGHRRYGFRPGPGPAPGPGGRPRSITEIKPSNPPQ